MDLVAEVPRTKHRPAEFRNAICSLVASDLLRVFFCSPSPAQRKVDGAQILGALRSGKHLPIRVNVTIAGHGTVQIRSRVMLSLKMVQGILSPQQCQDQPHGEDPR